MNQTSEIDVGAGLSQFERDGYLVLDGCFAPEQVDRAATAMRGLLDERPNEVVVDSVETGRRTFWSHADRRGTRRFEFNDLYLLCEEIRDLALDPELASVLEGLLGEPAVLFNSLNSQRGSSKHMHIDSLYLTPRTPHSLVSAWIAFEDVHPDAGPLFFYPGSHRIPLYRFNDGTHHATREEEADWFDYIDVQIRLRCLKQRKLLARKGDVFVWHGDMVHGGSQIRDMGRTRASMVCHYFGETDCRERYLDIVPANGAFWMQRQQQSVRPDPSVFGPQFPFPEESYLRRHPDVREGVEAMLFASGEYHYRHFGFGEGRGV
ncbi:MAG TPA: phytanoyl-CoA dioxygenase family protein [Opitutaceae bacterium]|nr:phytanoyl-CoA dioxygenase family protein [Opitutaceae bacterium]